MNRRQILTAEDKLDAIGDLHRREILLALHLKDPEEKSPFTVEEFVSNRELNHTKMIHMSLPKLNHYGLIDWDKRAGEFSKGPDFEEIGPLLSLLYEHRDDLLTDWFPSDVPD